MTLPEAGGASAQPHIISQHAISHQSSYVSHHLCCRHAVSHSSGCAPQAVVQFALLRHKVLG